MQRREGLELGESTVGRILSKGVRLGRVKPKRRRRFDGHAQRWRYGQRAARPGELVQIDHMSLHRDGKHVKEFKAVSPLGKQLVARAYARATALWCQTLPGSRASRSAAPAAVHPGRRRQRVHGRLRTGPPGPEHPPLRAAPRRPQFNGCVERANDTTRVEFWNLYQGRFTVSPTPTSP